jgi:hypothetical protein
MRKKYLRAQYRHGFLPNVFENLVEFKDVEPTDMESQLHTCTSVFLFLCPSLLIFDCSTWHQVASVRP